MPHRFVSLIVHVVFSTRGRAPALTPDLSDRWFPPPALRLATGDGAFAVSGSRLEAVKNYVARQQEHHRKVTFQKEFVSLLKKHGVPYEPNEVWS